MEALDLARHGPMQWRGKLVQLNGNEYVVGEQVGQGAEVIVMELVNRISGLCLHVLKIYRRQEQAAESIHVNTVKVGILLKAGTDVYWVIKVDFPGGLALAQRYLGLPEPDDAPTHQLLDRATTLLQKVRTVAYDQEKQLPRAERRKVVEAIDLCRAALQINPQHTVALNQLAFAFAQLHEWSTAAALQRELLMIERNYLLYWQNGVRHAMMANLPSAARELYSQMKQVFPYEGALNGPGIALNLECGRPEEAKRLLEEAGDSVRQMWAGRVEEALRAHSGSVAAVNDARVALASEDFASVVRHLERAHHGYRSDPLVALNLGLAYQRAGRYQDAAAMLGGVLGRVPSRFLAVTAANAAFSEIKLGGTQDAVSYLSVVASKMGADQPVVLFSLDDLPSVALWVDEDGVQQSSPDEADRMITEIVTSAGGIQAVPPAVAELAAGPRRSLVMSGW